MEDFLCFFSTENHPCKRLCCYLFEYKNTKEYACEAHHMKKYIHRDCKKSKFRKEISEDMISLWSSTAEAKKAACDISINYLTQKVYQFFSSLKKSFNEKIFQNSAQYINMINNFCQILISSPYIEHQSYIDGKALLNKEFILDERIIFDITFSTIKEMLPEIQICDPEEYQKLLFDLDQASIIKKEFEQNLIDLSKENQKLYDECNMLKEQNAKILEDLKEIKIKFDKQTEEIIESKNKISNIVPSIDINPKKINQNLRQRIGSSPPSYNENIKYSLLNSKCISKDIKSTSDRLSKNHLINPRKFLKKNIESIEEKYYEDNSLEIIQSPLKNSKTWKCLCDKDISDDILVCISCISLKPGEKGWVCKPCTTINKDMTLNKCSSCYAPRNASENYKIDYWICTGCNSHNVDSKIFCSSCNKRKIFEELKKSPQNYSKGISTESINEIRNKSCGVSSDSHNYSNAQSSKKTLSNTVRSKSINSWTCKKCHEVYSNSINECKSCDSYKFQTEKRTCIECKITIESSKAICDSCKAKNDRNFSKANKKEESKKPKCQCHPSCSSF